MTVRVWNDNVHPFEQKFRGEVIKVPAKGFVEMDDFDYAHSFVGQYSPITKDGGGVQDPRSYKMLRIEKDITKAPSKPDAEFICQFDGKKFPTQKLLDEHITENYADKILDEDEREKRMAAKAAKGK